MAHTSCRCGVGLWNGYGPGGVNWDIFPKWQVEDAVRENPDYSIIDAADFIADKYDNGNWNDLWLCRRCRRIQIWGIDGKYVSYRKTPFTGDVSTEDILSMEEWIAFSDWDLEEELPIRIAISNPFRPHRYFLSDDKHRIYIFNTKSGVIDFVYQEEVRQIDDTLFRDEKGL